MEKKIRITFIRSAINKKACQDKQQNQTTITTNINYIQNSMSILKKNLLKLKIKSDKLKLKKRTFTLLEKIWDHSIKRLGNNYTEKNKKTAKIKKNCVYF